MAGRKQIDEEVKRWDMKMIRFRVRPEDSDALLEILGEQSIQDHFEAYVKNMISEYDLGGMKE
jgi:hypothetical protein